MPNSTQPNFIVPTPTAGDSSNRSASTQFVATAIANAIGSTAFTASLATKAGTTQADFLAGGIRTPTNQSYRLIERVPYTLTFTQFVAQVSTGSMSAILKIDNATITGGALSVSTTQISGTLSAINTAAIGSALVLTVASTSNAANLSFIVSFNRTLATT